MNSSDRRFEVGIHSGRSITHHIASKSMFGIAFRVAKRSSTASFIESSLAAGEISRQDYLRLTSALLSNRMSPDECRYVNQMIDHAQNRRLKLVD